jgi:hypothetical protein
LDCQPSHVFGTLVQKLPIRVNILLVPVVLMRPSLGASLLQERVLAMWGRQLPWLHLVG